MKNYQKPDAEYVVLTTAEEIASGEVVTPGASGDVVTNPFGNWSLG